MQIEENHAEGTLAIDSHTPGRLEINGRFYEQPVCLAGNQVEPVEQTQPGELDVDVLMAAFARQQPPEVVLVGTGDKQVFLHPKITAGLAQQGIGLESMSTAAACRTYMVLQSEGRRVWAWLWP